MNSDKKDCTGEGGGIDNDTTDSEEQQKPTTWDDFPFPQLVQLRVFQYLDPVSLNNFRQVSASASHLIETVVGRDIVIPSDQWDSKPTLVAEIRRFLQQVEGRLIRSLVIPETPPDSPLFSLTRLLQHPQHLQYATIRNVELYLLHDFLSLCSSLRSFNYTSSVNKKRIIGDILQTFNNGSGQATFPKAAYQFPYLRQLILTTGPRESDCIDMDWGHLAYILMTLPLLPCLTTFKLEYNSEEKASYLVRLLMLSCVGNFLLKTPNLQEFSYCSLYRTVYPDREFDEMLDLLLKDLIRQFGTDCAQEVLIPRSLEEVFPILRMPVDRVQPLFATVGQSLKHIRKISLRIMSHSPNTLFTTMIQNLPGSAPLTSLEVVDYPNTDTLVTEAAKSKVYKLFTVLHDDGNNNGQPRQMLMPPPAYQTITELKLKCQWIQNTKLSLNKIVEQLPKLKSLYISEKSEIPHRTYGHFDENTGQSPFTRLEKLTLRNIHVGDLRSEAPSITGLILQCKNLKELDVQYFRNDVKPWYDHVNQGTHVADLLQILTSLPKLDKICLDKVFFGLLPEDLLSNRLDDVDRPRKKGLKRIRASVKNCKQPRRVVLLNGVLRNVIDFDFEF